MLQSPYNNQAQPQTVGPSWLAAPCECVGATAVVKSSNLLGFSTPRQKNQWNIAIENGDL